MFTDSELLTPDTRALIEHAFGTSIIDVFGSFETDNIAYQCDRSGEYHFAVDSGILEIVRDGVAVTDGDGELVVTIDGKPDFSRVMGRRHARSAATIRTLVQNFPSTFIAFAWTLQQRSKPVSRG